MQVMHFTGRPLWILVHFFIVIRFPWVWSLITCPRVCMDFVRVLWSRWRFLSKSVDFIIRAYFSGQGTFWLTRLEAFRPLPEETLVNWWVEWSVTGGSWRLGTELHLVRRFGAASSWLNTEIWSEVMCGLIERRNPAELSSSPSTNKQLTSTFALPVNVRRCTALLQIPIRPSSQTR